MKQICCIIILILSIGQSGWAEESSDRDPTIWTVIVSGINKDPEEMQMKGQAVLRLQKLFKQKMAIPESNIYTLLGKDSFAYQPETLESTSDSILKVLEILKDTVDPQDALIFYYTGQANIVKDKLRLNLPGSDLCHDVLAEHLNAIKAKRSLIVLDCPASGFAVHSLTKRNRILIMGAHVNQPWSTRLSYYFVPAMGDERSDYNKDGQISVLEAFRYAVMQLDDYYRQRDLIKTENPLLEDDGDAVASQQPWTWQQEKKDGHFASEWIIWEK